MAGKSYIKGSIGWSKIKKIYIKTGPVWTSVRKAYIKTGSIWKKIFDSTTSAMYTTETPTIRHDSYTGTIVSNSTIQLANPTGESRIGIKLWGRENPSSWLNGPYVSRQYQWYASYYSNGQNAYLIKDTSDTFYVDSTENNDLYDGQYLFFRAIYTNASGIPGVANSLPAYVHKSAPSTMTGASGVTSGISSTATEVGKAIQFDFAWHNEYYRSLDRAASTIEWFKGYPQSDKSNRLLVTTLQDATWIADNTTEFSGYTTYTPGINDVGSTIYIVMTGVNTYNGGPMALALNTSPVVSTYNTATTISVKPVINSPVTITKVDGYQTVGKRLSASTQTYTPSATTIYSGWQWASSATASDLNWKGLVTRYYNPIYGGYQYTNYFGYTESLENLNHELYIPLSAYDSTTSSDVSLVGKYLRFYSIGEASGAQSITNNSTAVGPIYDAAGTPGTPTLVWYQDGKATAYWSSSTNTSYYWLEYSSDQSTWTRTGVVQYSAPTISAQATYSSLPLGTYYYRVVAYNGDDLPAYSSVVSFDSAPPKEDFRFGDSLYIGTNGYISFTQGNSTPDITQTIGKVFGFYPGDLIADNISYASIHAEDVNDYFIIYWQGHRYGTNPATGLSWPSNEIKIEIWLPEGTAWYNAHIVFAKYSLSSITNSTISKLNYPGYYYNGIQKSSSSNYSVNGDDRQFYLDPTSGALALKQFTYKGSSWAGWLQLASNANLDDSYYSLTSFAPSAPSAPTLATYDTLTQTSARVTWSAPSSSGSTQISGYEYSVNNGSWVSVGSSLYAYVSGLTTGSNNSVRIRGVNYSGITSTNYATVSFTTLSGVGAFNTSSGSKSYPSGATQSVNEPTQNRDVTVNWNAASNAYGYEVALQGSSDNSTWSYVTIGGTQQTLDASAYVLSGTSKTFTAPYYRYYRYTVRARDADLNLSKATYSDGGTSVSLVWKNVDGTAPDAPSIGIITPGTGTSYNTATFTYTFPANPGSNTIDWNYYSIDGTNWFQTYSTSITLNNLAASTGYYLYMKSMNWDMIESGVTSQYFVTNAAPAYLTAPTSISVSKNGSNFDVSFSGGSGPYYQVWWTSASGVPTATSYDASGSSSPITVTNLLSPSQGTTYYFSVRSVDSLTRTGTGSSTSLTISPWSSVQGTYYVPYTPTVSMSANTGISQTSATINWTSTNQSYAYVGGTYVGNVNSYTFNGLSPATPYSGTVTVYSVDGISAQTTYSFTTSANVTYTITYNGNGNTGGSTTSTTGNGTVTLASNGFTRTNCNFSSWNTNSSGTGTNYSAGASYTLSADVTLYAKWAAVSNSATAPTGFKFDGNNLPTSGSKRWSWTGVGTVTGGTATGIDVQISSTSSTSGFTTASGSPLATSARSYSIAVSPVTSARWVKIAMRYTDGLGNTQIGTYTSAL